MLFKASAPGSLMLLGEYAVLHGKLALVCAVDRRMSVTFIPRQDSKITLSSALGHFTTDVSQIRIEKPFQFVLTTLKKFQKKLVSGCDIQIESEFSDKMGFASSASVTVATLAALSAWISLPVSKLNLVRMAREIIREVQGVGSGADVAACVFGGVIAYRATPLSVEELTQHFPLTVIYSGNKTPTVEAISRVNATFHDNPTLYNKICHAIDHCAVGAKRAIQTKNWNELGKLMNIQQGLMDALGVSTPILNELIKHLREDKNILGAKISGSGLGDCVIGLGQKSSSIGGEVSDVSISTQGVIYEKK